MQGSSKMKVRRGYELHKSAPNLEVFTLKYKLLFVFNASGSSA